MSKEPGPDDETMSAHDFQGEETMDLWQTRPPQYPAPPFPPGGSPAPPPHGAPVGQAPGASPTWQGPPPGPSPWQVPPPAAPPWPAPPGQPPHAYPAGAAGIRPGGYPPLPRRRRWPWWVVGAAAAVVAGLVITLVALGNNDSKTTSNSAAPSSTRIPASSRPAPTSSAPSAPPPLDTAALPSLLASAEQVSNILHNVQMNPRDVSTSLSSDASIDPAKCASAVAPALEGSFKGSGYTGVAVQGLMEPSPGRHKVIQAVAAFPDETAAQQFQAQQVSAWQGCRLTDVTVSFPGGQPADHATITIVSNTDGIASTVLLPAGATEHKDSECERAMAVRRNIIVDVRVCGQNTITAGVSLVRAITDNIAGHR